MGVWRDIRHRRSQWMLLIAVLIGFAVMVATSLYQERRRIIQEQSERLSTQARVIDENIQRQLTGVSKALQSVIHDFDRFRDQPEFLTLRLKALTDAMPGVRTINVLNRDGFVVASNRDNVLGIDLSGREYFQTAARIADPNVLYLSEPFKTVLGVYSVNVVRVALSGDGVVDRMVTATLDPEFFQVLLSSVRFADDAWVALAHRNGRLFLHYPDRPDLLGFDLNKPGSFFSRHMDANQPATVLTGRVATTGQMAWMAQRTITAPQLNMRGELVIAVARSADEALRYWRDMALFGAVTVLLVSIAAVLALRGRHRAHDRDIAMMVEEEKRRRRAEEEIRHMAFYDQLTQLPNRRLLFDRLAQLLASSVRHGRYSALLFLDLDGFKVLNDQHGHDKGDLLLQQVAQRLSAQIRQGDTAARWAGDEFVVMLAELGPDAQEANQRASRVADKILRSLGEAYELDGLSFCCTASLGITLFGDRKEPLDDIIKRADQVMYKAKALGRNTYESTHRT